MKTWLALPNFRHHITQKVRIAGQRTRYISVHDDEHPAEIFLRLKGSDCTSELIGLYDVIARLMRVPQGSRADRKLTPKEQRFVQEYAIDLNGTQAAIRAGYSPKTARDQLPPRPCSVRQ
ncbi:MAG: terminase small subunit [Nitrospirota bacterium]